MNADKRRAARTQGRFSFPPDKKSAPRVNTQPAATAGNSGVLAQNKYQYEESNGQNIFVPPFVEKVPPVRVFESKRDWFVLSGEGSEISRIYYDPDFILKDRKVMFNELLSNIRWENKMLMTEDGPKPLPRQVAWYGPLNYKYSSIIMESNLKWPDRVNEIRVMVEMILDEMGLKVTFNSVLLNLYKDGHDSVAWHSDDELSMGVDPTIASVSLGTTRRFELARKRDAQGQRQYDPAPEHCVNLEDGSLLVMDGVMQRDWLHRVPKEYHDRGPRINLTFRTVQESQKRS